MTTQVQSSWISSVSYLPLPTPGKGWVAFFLHPKPRVNGCDDGPSAILYGPELPSWLPGLVTAGLGGKSIGRAYHRLVKGKYKGQTIKGQAKVDELKRLMKGQIDV